MADISDVTAYLSGAAQAAVYPNGIGQPSVAAMDVRLFEGWPLPDQLDLDMSGQIMSGSNRVVRPKGPLSNVSIFPMLGMNSTPYQIQDNVMIISLPVYGIVVAANVNGFTASGVPSAGEYLTVIVNKTDAYSRTGASLAAVISALAADMIANYPDVISTSTSLALPTSFSVVVRQGGAGVMGKATHRQKQSVMVTVWSPNHRARTLLAAAIDNAIKQKIVVTLPDTSQALICFNRTNVIDDQQAATVYRRDLIYDVEYATVQQFPGYVVTTVNVSIANYNNSAIAPAVT